MSASRYPFGRAELVRLWFSYQRHAFVLVALNVAIVASIALLAPRAWYLWLLAAIPIGKIGALAWWVLRRWPRKLRATALASRRIENGRFRPRMVRNFCDDPCFRVVAHEILRRAGMSRGERREVVRQFAKELSQPAFLMVVDRDGPSPVVRVEGSAVGNLITETASTMEAT